MARVGFQRAANTAGLGSLAIAADHHIGRALVKFIQSGERQGVLIGLV
jgi:hypothetical protein